MTSLPNGSWRARQTLYAVLKRLVGAKWGRCVVLKGNFDPTSGKTKQARVDFIKAYAHALKLQAETKTPVVDAGRLVAHTHANINAWIKADGVLQGTVDDLYEVPNAYFSV